MASLESFCNQLIDDLNTLTLETVREYPYPAQAISKADVFATLGYANVQYQKPVHYQNGHAFPMQLQMRLRVHVRRDGNPLSALHRLTDIVIPVLLTRNQAIRSIRAKDAAYEPAADRIVQEFLITVDAVMTRITEE